MVTQMSKFMTTHPFYRGFVEEGKDIYNCPIYNGYNRREKILWL